MKKVFYLGLLVALTGYDVLEATEGSMGTGCTDDDGYQGWVSCGCHAAPKCKECGTEPYMCNGNCTWKREYGRSGCVLKNGAAGGTTTAGGGTTTATELKQEGESCGSCMCPPTYTAGTCEDGLTCVHNPLIADASGVCTNSQNTGAAGGTTTAGGGTATVGGGTTTATETSSYRVSGIHTEVVTASILSTIFSDRKQYLITKMPEELVNSTLFQPTVFLDISTIEIYSAHKAMIYVGVYESRDGGLMEVLPKLGWKLEDGWFVEWNKGAKARLHKIWSLQIEAGQSITFTTTKKDMTFAIFIAKATEEITYRVSGIPTEVVTASNGSTIWSDRKYFITKMPEELVNSTLFQPTHYVDISTIEIFSAHRAMIYVGVFESKDGGLMEVLPKLGWKLEDGWFVEWNNGPKERLHKIWSLQIEAGQSITFTTTKKTMTFAIFIAKATEDSVKLVDSHPYLKIGSTWKPICGHYFWDNNIGASIFCIKLGYPKGGVIIQDGQPYNEDAHFVGKCEDPDNTDLENGCKGGSPKNCKKGTWVSVKVKCTGGWVEYIGQHFTDNQCRNIGNKVNHDLSACKTVCDGNKECTAINFNPGKKLCIPRACGPAGSAAGWNSYMKSGGWVEYIGQYFIDNQCRNLGNKVNHDLSACKTVCDGNKECTAINFNLGKKMCTLRACDFGPAGSAVGWNSYMKSD